VSGGLLEEYVARVGERADAHGTGRDARFSTHPDSEDDAPVLVAVARLEVLVERLTPETSVPRRSLALRIGYRFNLGLSCQAEGDHYGDSRDGCSRSAGPRLIRAARPPSGR